jgi:hypothetical protein
MIAICLSPWGQQSLGVEDRPLSDGVSAGTPLGAAEYLRAHPPQGLIFNTFEWGDYLLWAGPPDIRLFADSHVHLLPHQVWSDYQRIRNGGSAGPRLLDNYQVQLVVIDHDRQPYLVQRMQLNPKWTLVYEDARARIYARK